MNEEEEVFFVRYTWGNIPNGASRCEGMARAMRRAMALCAEETVVVLGIFNAAGELVVSAARIADLYHEKIHEETRGMSL